MTNGPLIDDLRQGFRAPSADCRPMMRWWWFGPTLTRAELERELLAIAAAGFGGVEVSYVYPLAPVEHPFLSEEFLAHLRFAAERARQLGLRFDLTLGSGWSFGGPHIGDDLAARKLHWERFEVQLAAVDVPVVAPWPGDRLVAAYIGAGTAQERPEKFTELPIADGTIRIPAGGGPRVILLAYSRTTGQNVKRAAAGAEGPVLDHYSAAAAQEHLRRVADPLIAAVPPELVGSVFCDSLEVYGADWTPELLPEFQRRRGYDARPRLFQLIVDGAGADRLRIDFYRTLTELYEENFVTVFQQWAAGHGLPFRIQGYGTPPATVSSYRFADLYEGEGWGWKELTQTRWASSAAHLYGKSVVSSEVWTWVHSPSFRATPLDLKGEAHEHFLLGINQFFGHGWPYSPTDAPGLGWFFYASGALDDRNPWWPAMLHLNGYLQRLSWLLRQGEHVSRVKIYIPAGDVYPTMGESLDLWRDTRRYVGPEIPRVLREYGLDFDLIDDDAVEVLAPSAAPVVILPKAKAIPAATTAWLDEVIAAGGSVIAVGDSGFGTAIEATPDTLAATLREVSPPDVTVIPAIPDIGVLHRRTGDSEIYFVANTGNVFRSFEIAPHTGYSHYELWDASSGAVRDGGRTATPLTLELHPYEAAVIVAFDGDGDGAAGPLANDTATGSHRLDDGWTVEFLDDPQPTSAAPVTLPHRWETDRTGYSGSAAYETTLQVEPSWLTGPVRLDFGPVETADAGSADSKDIRGNSYRAHVSPPVREVAVVHVNDAECGILWAPPYELDIAAHLTAGANRLRVVVHNTAANALAADTAIHRAVEASTARYGRRFRMQDLELALDGVASGLLAVPSLRWGGG